MKLTKGLTWPLLLLAFATLIVYMAGLASLQRSCDGGIPLGNPTNTTTRDSAIGLSSGYSNCNTVFRFHWFSFAFVAATLIGLMITAAIGAGLHYSRPFWIGMLAISTVLMMMMSEVFLGETYMVFGAPWMWVAKYRVTVAGAIMTVISLVLLMMAVGTDWEHRRGTSGNNYKADTGVTTGMAVPARDVRVVDTV